MKMVSETEIEVWFLYNFGSKVDFKRYEFENERKKPRKSAFVRGYEVRGEVS